MKDVIFVIAGYGAILGGLVVYAFTLLRRLAAARQEVQPADSADASDTGDDGRA